MRRPRNACSDATSGEAAAHATLNLTAAVHEQQPTGSPQHAYSVLSPFETLQSRGAPFEITSGSDFGETQTVHYIALHTSRCMVYHTLRFEIKLPCRGVGYSSPHICRLVLHQPTPCGCCTTRHTKLVTVDNTSSGDNKSFRQDFLGENRPIHPQISPSRRHR